jgi:hypothetical protein
VGQVRVGVQGDVGDRVSIADEEGTHFELAFHGVKRRVASLVLGVEYILRGRCLGDGEPEARDGDVGLVTVLLEEQLLQGLGAFETIRGNVRGTVREIPQDGIRLCQRAAIIEHQGRHTQRRIESSQKLRPSCAVNDIHLHPFVLQAELGEQQSDL